MPQDSKSIATEDFAVIDQIRKEGEPMRLTNYMVDKPGRVMIIGFSILVLFTAITLGLQWFNMNPQHQREYLIWDDIRTQVYDMRMAGLAEVTKLNGEQS